MKIRALQKELTQYLKTSENPRGKEIIQILAFHVFEDHKLKLRPNNETIRALLKIGKKVFQGKT